MRPNSVDVLAMDGSSTSAELRAWLFSSSCASCAMILMPSWAGIINLGLSKSALGMLDSYLYKADGVLVRS